MAKTRAAHVMQEMLRQKCFAACADGLFGNEDRDGYHSLGYDWVDPTRTRTKQGYPYSYSEFYLWRDKGFNARTTKASGVYSDRMMGWDFKKFNDWLKKVGSTQMGMGSMTRKDAEQFLTGYFGKKSVPVAMAQGCNPSNGYPYWIFWYKTEDQ